MTTNALLLKRNIEYLARHNFKILISLDGNKKHNSYRVFSNGEESFKYVYENVMYVKTYFPEYYKSNINFNSVLHNRNSISEIFNYIKAEFAKVPNIEELNNTGIKKEKMDEFYCTYKNASESLYQAEDYKQIRKEMFTKLGEIMSLSLFLLKYSGNFFDSYNDLIFSDSNLKYTPTGTCIPFGKKMYLTVKGKILTCEKIGQQFALGKVSASQVDLQLDTIVEKYNKYYQKVIFQCKECYNADTCVQCLYNLTNLNTRPICHGFTNKTNFQKDLYLNMEYLDNNAGLYNELIKELMIVL